MDDTLWSTVTAERLGLADLLAGLDPEQWQTRSLCAEWTVRDVAAHLAMTPTEPTLAGIALGLVRARGDIWAFGRDIARDHARRPTAEIVDELRRTATSRHLPPLTNPDNALLDVIVHGQDITRPLGIEHPVPTAAGVATFHRAWSMGWPFHARRRLRGLRLVATDADLAVGSGPPVRGRLVDLLLLATGRAAAARPGLSGPGCALLPDVPTGTGRTS